MSSRTLQDLVDSFALFDSWEDRYRYIIDLGERLEVMDEELKVDSHLVPGCTSRVWLVPVSAGDNKLSFLADSDAKIVRGLIYILKMGYDGRTLEEIAAVDIEKHFQDLGLDQHLSPSRRNGFFSMVEKIKNLPAAG